MWYTLAGALITIVVGLVTSKACRMAGAAHVPPAPKLLAPFIRQMCMEPPHPSDEPFIRAYDDKVSIIILIFVIFSKKKAKLT